MSVKLPSVGIVSLGCPKNLVDTEVMLGYLQREGLTLGDPDASRVVIVNTCGFIDQAKEESVNAVLEQVRRKEAGEIDRVVVAGCMVQKYGAELAAEIPEVDHFLGLDELEKAPAAALGLPTLPTKSVPAALCAATHCRLTPINSSSPQSSGLSATAPQFADSLFGPPPSANPQPQIR